ncbi:S49 family peptidase [Raineyella sp.]|uniref:S49 family peptidase n=1 Tax=Raineyella sp. TaxID=1911550 RepID=UPI002B21DFB5|nr:S49 family peptidase [Raineyella sp.]MEA5153719.1 S49 family peptidase [Raineyella sp.]
MSQPPSDHDDAGRNEADHDEAADHIQADHDEADRHQADPGEVAADQAAAPDTPAAAWPPPKAPMGSPQAPGIPPQPVPAPYRPMVPPRRGQGAFGRGFGLGAGAGLGLGAAAIALSIVGALLGAIALVAAPTVSGAGTAEQLHTIWGDPKAKHTLRAIPITGTIMGDSSDGLGLTVGTYGYEVARVIDKLSADDADGIVLLMNTPGGSITGSRAIADAVDRYRARTGHKVFAHVEGMSASGGMYAMANADRIVADHGSLIGSIGVISGPFVRYRDITGTPGSLLESGVTTKGGITYEYLTMGRDKDFGSPYRDMRPEERDVWMNGLAVEYDAFVEWVAQHRGIPADTIRTAYGAHMFDSQTAVTNRYADAVGGQDEAFRDFATRSGVDPADTRVEQATAPGLLATLLGVEARPLGVAPAAKAEGNTPARATAKICSGAPQVLAYQGDTAAFCG